ncbi:rRNA methyltransferase [Siminovitchia fortis]|uniref:rRNA methyltransferase n=1 Tax=Siminovitchia fortis TaxID=254758 RepID=UPI001F1B1BCC|nr:rRNA methyltransferase [Siminovitchia fortis]WHY83133.1 rRNA methyltransferase [Siminovitchia fortis]
MEQLLNHDGYVLTNKLFWKMVNGKLIKTNNNETIVKFRTNVSKSILDQLDILAADYNIPRNHLIQNGLQNLLDQEQYIFNTESRPKDRVQYKTTYHNELLDDVRRFAKKHRVSINDVIEHSVKFIDVASHK